jgi:phosphate-selective porin OprO/OprP
MKKINSSRFALLGLIILLLTSGTIFAQTKNVVTGKVFPAGMNAPMNGVTVQVQGDESTTVVTDGIGFFQIEVPSFPVQLVFTKETYEVNVVTVKKESDIMVNMKAISYKTPNENIVVDSKENESVVTGTVFPAGMQTPMSGVKVQIQDNASSAILTDGNGFFRMEVSSFPVKLVFSKETYATQVIEVKKPVDITVYMSPGKKVENDYGQEVGVRVSLNPESRDGILVLSSTDNRFRYWFDNRVYFDGAVYAGSNNYQGDDNAMGNGVIIRRARFAMKAILWGNWGGEIDFDFANDVVEVKDAYARYIGRNWQIKAGNFREPFSLETMTTSRYITLMERPYATEQAPSRHMGIAYKVFTNHLFFEGGVFSSVITNTLIRDENKSNGTNAGWSATARLAWAPIKKDQQVLHFGVAGSYRKPKIPELGDPTNSFRYAENAETEVNRKKYIDTDWIEDGQYKILLGLEAAYAVKNYKVQGEYIMTRIQRDVDEVPEGEDKVKLGGFYVMGSWLLNNADYYYNMADAEFSQIDFRNNKKGAFEVALRYSFMNANTFAENADTPFIPGGSGEVYTAGVSYYFNYNVKIMLNYSYANHDRWADGKGKYKTFNVNSEGQDITPTGQGGIDFSTIQARLLISF